MADHIHFNVSATPVEELTDENSNTIKVISGEVATALGGGGDGVDVANYSAVVANQGYKDGAVGYLDCTHSTGGTRLTGMNNGDFFYIKNTGHKFSSATVLGDVTTDCVMVVIRIPGYVNAGNGGWYKSDDTSQVHFFELAWLKPNQAIVLPVAGNSLHAQINEKFGSNVGDLTYANEETGADNETAYIYVRTFSSAGSAVLDGNAVEFLSVD